jgi:hypothetical protein
VDGLKEFFARLVELASGLIIGLFQGDFIQLCPGCAWSHCTARLTVE